MMMMLLSELYQSWKSNGDISDSGTLPLLLPLLKQEILPRMVDACWLMVYLLIPTLALELWSLETALALYKKNPRLYITAVGLNFFNHFVSGVPGYVLGVFFLAKDNLDTSTMVLLVRVMCQVLVIMVIHSLCFYHVHKIFHTYPKLYKWHKFHHLFNTLVTPMTANAVSPVEYVVGYLAPFLVSMVVLRPMELSIWIAIQVISMFNLVMHTPKLQFMYDNNKAHGMSLPPWMVSTADHLEHHKRLNCHYAAPTLNVDYLAAALLVVSSGVGVVNGGGKTVPVPAAVGANNSNNKK